MKITGAKAIIKALELENSEVIFGYPGAAICPFYDALLDSKIMHVLTRHEQGAVHGASGYARATGKTGVCVATSGPGATNLITGIATAYMDSIPVVAITGQVPTDQIGRDVFQEADITGATTPFCKHNYLIKRVEDIPRVIKEAFHIASTGRPGPVLIDIPIDIQKSELDFKYPQKVDIIGYKPNYKGHSLQIKKAAKVLQEAKRPVICAGGGIISANASKLLHKLVDKCSIPVVTTLMGIGTIPSNHELNLGMLGSHGSYAANYAVNNTDLLMILGARAGDRAIAATSRIAGKAQVIHIDIDPAEIGKNISTSIPIVGDVGLVLEELIMSVERGDVGQWVETVKNIKKEHPFKYEKSTKSGYVNPKGLLKLLSERIDDDTIITTEVGQNQIWAANFCGISSARRFITSGGMGTMGYGLPAAIGAKIGCPDMRVINISGDGSFQMTMQELGTMKQNKVGVKIILFNNSRLGMVRELQKTSYNCRYSQVFLEDNPDFIKLVEAYGFRGERINSDSEIEGALKRLLEDDEPYFLECVVDPDESTR